MEPSIQITGKALTDIKVDPIILHQDFRIMEQVCCICLTENTNIYGVNNPECLHISLCASCFVGFKTQLPKFCPLCKKEGEFVFKQQKTVIERVIDYSHTPTRDQARSNEVMTQVNLLIQLKGLIEKCFECKINDPKLTQHFNLPQDPVDKVSTLIELLNHRFDVKKLSFDTNPIPWTTVYIPENIISLIFPIISKVGFFPECHASQAYFRFEQPITFHPVNNERKIVHYELLPILRNIRSNKITFSVLVDIGLTTPSRTEIGENVIPQLKRFEVTQQYDKTKYKQVFVTFTGGSLFWSLYSPEDIKTIETDAINTIYHSQGIYTSSGYGRDTTMSNI